MKSNYSRSRVQAQSHFSFFSPFIFNRHFCLLSRRLFLFESFTWNIKRFFLSLQKTRFQKFQEDLEMFIDQMPKEETHILLTST